VNINGFAEANAQTGIENITLSAVTSTGSYGFQVTANASGSVITGSQYNDTIIMGAGEDDVVFLATNGVDTVTSFTAGTDDANVGALTTSTTFDGTYSVATSTTAKTLVDGDIFFVTGAAAGDADAKAAAATEITASAAWTNGTNGDIVYFVVVDDNSTGIFKMVEAQGTEVVSSELTLIATLDAVAVSTSDFIF
jgi:hypothetical protein